MTKEGWKGMVVSATYLLIFCACFMVGTGLAAGQASLSVDPALTDGLAPTDTFSVDVVVDSDGSDLSAVELAMGYDTSALSVTAVTYTGLMGAANSDVFIIQDPADDGEIWFALADTTPAAQAGTVVTVDFAVKAGAADGTYLLDLNDVTLVNGGAAIPGVNVNDGEAKVGDGVIPIPDTPYVKIIADTGPFAEGEAFQATVMVDSVDDTLAAVQFDMAYDTSALSVTGATYSGLMEPGVLTIDDLADDGEISVSLADSSPATQNGLLLTIDLEVKAGAADGTYLLDLNDVTLVNGGTAIPGVDVIDDTVDVETVPEEPMPEGIELLPGWNLISIPETLENGSIDYVLQDFNDSEVNAVFYDNAATGMMEAPDEFEPLKAYWINNNMSETVVINETYLTPMVPSTPPTLTVYPGWNAIGHTAMVELPAEVALSTIDECYVKVTGPWLVSTSEFAYVGHNGKEGVINGNQVGTDVFAMNMYEGYYVFVDEVCVLA